LIEISIGLSKNQTKKSNKEIIFETPFSSKKADLQRLTNLKKQNVSINSRSKYVYTSLLHKRRTHHQ